MKTKEHFRLRKNFRAINFILCTTALLVAFSSCGEKKSSVDLSADPRSPSKPVTMTGSDTVWLSVDEMPVFQGGDTALLKYLALNTNYPEVAKTSGTQGKVIVRFCVTSRGNVTACEILKSVSPEIDAEALRVVSTLPQFEPGKVKGKAVAVWYMVPITFALR